MRKNGVVRLSQEARAEVVVAIREQAERVRQLKAQQQQSKSGNSDAFWAEVYTLLRLKYALNISADAPLPSEDDLAVPMQREGCLETSFKLRWALRDGPGGGAIVRLQRPLQMRTTVSGREVCEAVASYTRTRVPALGAPLKLELPSSHFAVQRIHQQEDPSPSAAAAGSAAAAAAAATEEKPKAVWRAVAETDLFLLPLIFPGPRLANTYAPEFRVTFPAVPSNVDTPREYDALPALPQLVDAGCNLFASEFAGDVDGVVHRAAVAGVSQLVALSVDAATSRTALQLAETHVGTVFATVGIHPESVGKLIAGDGIDAAVKEIADIARQSIAATASAQNALRRVVAIGEIGIDREAKDSPIEAQAACFERQLVLAAELKLPVIIHDRAAFAEVTASLDKVGALPAGGIVNCFNGSAEQLDAYTKRGFLVCLTGLLCNDARAADLRVAIAHAPLNCIVIGSDAPYLTPFTMERPFPVHNEPRTLPHVAVQVAKCLNVPVSELAAASTANVRRVLGLPVLCYDGTHGERPYTFDPNAKVPRPKRPQPAKPAPLSEEEIKELLADGEVSFAHDGKAFACAPRDRDVLESQRKALPAEAFAKLVADFKLRELRRLTVKEKKRKEKKPGEHSGARRGGRGGHRGGRGRGGRGRGGRGRGHGAPAAAAAAPAPAAAAPAPARRAMRLHH